MNTKGGDILCNVNHAEHNIRITFEPARTAVHRLQCQTSVHTTDSQILIMDSPNLITLSRTLIMDSLSLTMLSNILMAIHTLHRIRFHRE